jgi:hypothetical protein
MGLMDIIVIDHFLFGLFFFFGGAVGILRFPDFYTRLHPAGKLDTMGSLFMLGHGPVQPPLFRWARYWYELQDHADCGLCISGQPHRHPRHCGRRHPRGAQAFSGPAERGKGSMILIFDLHDSFLVMVCASARWMSRTFWARRFCSGPTAS